MINTYDEYLKEFSSISFEEMHRLHNEMLEEIGTDADALEVYEGLIEESTSYAAIRAKWLQMSREEKTDKDARRTSNHNSIIIQLNMLARYLKMLGKKAEWRDKLGYEDDNAFARKTIGDFACYLVFVNSLCAR